MIRHLLNLLSFLLCGKELINSCGHLGERFSLSTQCVVDNELGNATFEIELQDMSHFSRVFIDLLKQPTTKNQFTSDNVLLDWQQVLYTII